MSRGLKPKFGGGLNVWDKSQTYLKSKYGGPFATLRMTAKTNRDNCKGESA